MDKNTTHKKEKIKLASPVFITFKIAIFLFAFTIILDRPKKERFFSNSSSVSAFQLSASFHRPRKHTLSSMDNNDNNDNDGLNANANHSFDLSKFSKEEKLSWLGGYDLWNLRAIPGLTDKAGSPNETTSLCLSDGPHGLRKPLNTWTLQEAHPATCFPSACSTACSWNPALLETMGNALAKECELYGVHILLGPGVNLKRHPCGGRNHEYFSEDPLLSGLLAKSYIAGVQKSGNVGACLKHFCLNNQESNRFVVDVIVDERTMRELYLPAFEYSLCSENKKSVPKMVMGAYNKVNGTYCCESKYLLRSILRGEWKYDGVVVSDWGAILDRSASIRAGMDLEMPGSAKGAYDDEVLEECASERSCHRENDEEEQFIAPNSNSQHSGELETSISECANRVVRLISDLHSGDKKQNDANNNNIGELSTSQKLFDEHNQLAREIARECIVLLQNKNDFLPLSRESTILGTTPKIGVVGCFAKDSPRYQGMGSAHVTPTKVTTIYEALESFYCEGNDDSRITIPFAKGYDPDIDGDEVQQSLINEAVRLAQQPNLDVLVVCVGLPEIAESEGFDRTHSRLPKQHVSLVEALTQVHPNVVVVLSNGGIVEIPQFFVDKAKAILDGFLTGQAGGPALVDVLFGVTSPSGKLPETIPIAPDTDVPSANYFPGNQHKVEYREGLDVGYRYYDTMEIPVRFPFGHGLNYANLKYRNLEVNIERDEAASKRVVVSLDVENTGKSSFTKPVMEVIQLYIQPLSPSVYRPIHELKGFSKIEIAQGATKRVEFTLDERAFSYYDIGLKDWVVEICEGFEIKVGASSRDIRLTDTLRFVTGKESSDIAKASYPPMTKSQDSLSPKGMLIVDDETFTKRFGLGGNNNDSSSKLATMEESSTPDKNKGGTITRNTLMVDAAEKSRIAAILMFVSWIAAKQEVKEGPTKKRELRMIRANLENVPLRSLVVFSQGHLTFRALDVLIHLMNGRYKKALKRLFTRKRKRKN